MRGAASILGADVLLATKGIQMRSIRFSAPTAALVVLLGVAAPTASAAPTWHFSAMQNTTINDCITDATIAGAAAYVGAYYDDASPPKAGDVFPVEDVFNGVDTVCGELALPAIALPPGLALATGGSNQIGCYSDQTGSNTSTPDQADCPASLGPPLYGGTGSIPRIVGGKAQLWDIGNGNGYIVSVPVVATAPGAYSVTFPTHVSSAGTYAAVGEQTLTPSITVPVAAGKSPGPIALIQRAGAAKSVRLKTAIGHGIPVSITLGAPGRVTVALTVKRARLARYTRSAAAGKLGARLRIARKDRKRFKHPTRPKIVITVVPAAGGAKATATRTITIRP